MIKFVKQIAIFLIISPIFIVLFTIVWGEFSPKYFTDNFIYKKGSGSFLYHRLREADTVKNVDVLVLGASQAYRDFDPRVFEKNNLKLFTLGSSNQTQIQTESLVNKYFKKINPKIIVFVLNHESFSMDGVESGLDFICNGTISLNTLKMVFKVNNVKTWFSFIYATYRQILGLDKNFEHLYKIREDEYIKCGYVEKDRIDFSGEIYKKPFVWQVRKKQKKAFDNTIDKLKNSKAKIVLLQAPHEKTLYENIDNNDEYQQYYKNTGIDKYYNYNELMGLTTNYFYDNFHLNKQGVDTFSNNVAIRLTNIIKAYP